jgi:putative flavoprotein involved in K+ transport
MAARGIVLLSHSKGIEDGDLILADDLEQHLAKGNESFESFKKSVDEYVKKAGLEVPEEQESEVVPNIRMELSTPVSHLNLKDAGVSAIVWASGFRYDFDWVKLPIFDDGGEPVHRRGVTQLPGVYFLGLRWLYKRRSSFLLRAGPAEDAGYLSEQIMVRN